jgi:hypothetical protein
LTDATIERSSKTTLIVSRNWVASTSLIDKMVDRLVEGGSKAPSFWTRFVTYLQYQDVSMPVMITTIPELSGLTFYNGEGANVIPVPVTESPKSGYAVSFTPPKSGTVGTDVIALSRRRARREVRRPVPVLGDDHRRQEAAERADASHVQHGAHVADRGRQVGDARLDATVGGAQRGPDDPLGSPRDGAGPRRAAR